MLRSALIYRRNVHKLLIYGERYKFSSFITAVLVLDPYKHIYGILTEINCKLGVKDSYFNIDDGIARRCQTFQLRSIPMSFDVCNFREQWMTQRHFPFNPAKTTNKLGNYAPVEINN